MRRRMMYIQNTILLLSFLAANLPAGSQDVLHEKSFVHTDKNYYQTGELIWFSIYNVNDKIIPSGVSKLAYVELLDSINKPVLQTKIRLDSGRGTGSFIIPANVATGIYSFRTYTNWMKNFGPESFFQKDIAIVNAANGKRAYKSSSGTNNPQNDTRTLQVKVQPDKAEYQKRQKVKLTISSSPISQLSISAYRLDSLTGEDPARIDMLADDDNTRIKDPVAFPYPPEYKGHFVNGRMISRNTRMPSRNVTGYLSIMDDANSFYNGRTDSAGRIKFLVTKLNSADSIVVQSHSIYDPDQQIEIESPFFDKYAAKKSSLFTPTDEFPSTVLEQSINAQVNQLYYEDQLNRFRVIKYDSIPFYNKEDMHYVLDDFTRFSKLEDIFREYIRPVGVTRRQGTFHLTVFNETNRYIIDQQPLVLVDAIPVFDMNTLFNYDPLKVKTIDIVQEKYFRSGAVFPGIISLTTFRGRTDGQMIDPNANVLGYEIVQKQRSFYSPAYENGGSKNLPDFRSTLYWNPSIHTDAWGNAIVEFYTSDLEGEFVICVQGIGDGGVGSARARVSVK